MIRHSKRDAHTGQSFEYCHDWICETLVILRCHSAKRDTFSGSLLIKPISSLQLTDDPDKMELLRSPRRIANGRENCYLIAFEGRTSSTLVQDGREGVLHTDDFAIVDSCRPYSVLIQKDFKHPRSTNSTPRVDATSVRYRADIFSSNVESVSAYLWERRLTNASWLRKTRHKMVEPSLILPSVEDLMTCRILVRAFRDRYGRSPTEVRERATIARIASRK